jgi:hypothetical protein
MLINNKKIICTIKRFQIAFIFLIFIILGMIYWSFNKIQLINVLFGPILIIPKFFANLITSFTINNIFSYGYFWDFYNIPFWTFFITFTVINSVLVLLLLNKKTRRYVSYIILIFFTIALVLKALKYYKDYSGYSIIISGGGNIYPFIQDISVLVIGLLLLIYSKEISKKELIKKSLFYSIFLLEVFIGILVGLLLIKRITVPGTSLINMYFFPIFIIIAGFYFYILLELIKKYFLKKIE